MTIESQPSLSTLPEGYRAIVFGASGGIGAALAAAIAADPRAGAVHLGARGAVTLPPGPCTAFRFDLADEESIAASLEAAAADGPLHCVIVATGALHDGARFSPEKTWRSLSAASLAEVYAINTIGPALIAKHALGRLARGDKAVFAALSARVGSISDNGLGGWHAYRASKAALNMLLRNFAIELAQRNTTAIVAGLHPGTVDTGLSKPFQAGVRPEKLFTPSFAAARLLGVLDRLSPTQSGRVFAWDGAEIPP